MTEENVKKLTEKIQIREIIIVMLAAFLVIAALQAAVFNDRAEKWKEYSHFQTKMTDNHLTIIKAYKILGESQEALSVDEAQKILSKEK